MWGCYVHDYCDLREMFTEMCHPANESSDEAVTFIHLPYWKTVHNMVSVSLYPKGGPG